MDLASSIATSRLVAQQRAMDVIAGNIANADTPGYKATRVLFSDWLAPQEGANPPPGGATIAFTQDRATWREQAPGPVHHTGNPLDIAITATGWFSVSTSRGIRLTRDGRFGLMPDGTIADAAGDPLLNSTGNPIRIAPTDTNLTITADGSLSSENGQIARIGVVQPANPMQLAGEGGTLFRADTPTSTVAQPRIVQGAVEGSNVQPVAELTRMIDTEREFQFVTQMVQAESDRERDAINKLLPGATS
jgi:flagellar basal-body rod protein FlgF